MKRQEKERIKIKTKHTIRRQSEQDKRHKRRDAMGNEKIKNANGFSVSWNARSCIDCA